MGKENVNFAKMLCHGCLSRLKKMTSSKYEGRLKWISPRALEWLAPALSVLKLYYHQKV